VSGTHEKRKEPAAILIVQEEEVFSGFLQHFPAGRYALLYAAGAAESMALCETRPPKLIIMPGGPAMAGLTEALREVSRHKSALLAVVQGKVPSGDPPPGIDRVVSADDLEAIIEASTELLKDRREKPRVLVEIPIRLDEDGEGVARDLSANFMQIHTHEKLKSGQTLMVEIGWGDEPMQFSTKVFKADTSVLGATVAMTRDPGLPRPPGEKDPGGGALPAGHLQAGGPPSRPHGLEARPAHRKCPEGRSPRIPVGPQGGDKQGQIARTG